MDLYYSFFGLRLRSNLPLPGVTPILSNPGFPLIELHLGISPRPAAGELSVEEELAYVGSHFTETGEPSLRIWRESKGEFLRIAYSDGTQFWIDRKRESVWAVWPGTLSLEDTASYLLGPILGLLLRLRGVTCLHASAVAFDNRSVAFVGPEGAGKSTTAAALAQQGYGVLSDDIVALVEQAGEFRVMPAYPHLSLWPDSVKMLYGSAGALPCFSPEWDKRRLALGENGTHFECRPLPLAAIYVLGERRPDPAPFVEAIRPQAALLSLVADTYANKILDRDLRASEFNLLARLASSVAVRRVHPSNDPARLDDLCKVIRDDYASLPTLTSAQS